MGHRPIVRGPILMNSREGSNFIIEPGHELYAYFPLFNAIFPCLTVILLPGIRKIK